VCSETVHNEPTGRHPGLIGQERFDVCIVGAGLIGLAVATALDETFNGMSILIVDKENEVAAHQSSHNSGVVHSGLYYKPGSLKARLCVEGRIAVHQMCEVAGVAHAQPGKLVIATDVSQIPALDELERRGNANGLIGLRRVGPDQIAEIEPAAVGVDALHVPEAGIADFPGLAKYLASQLVLRGTKIATGSAVSAISQVGDEVTVTTGQGTYTSKVLVNCAGLFSDVVARMVGVTSGVRIVPFRGEYYRLSSEASSLVRSLIYPVPDPRFPFLGVHFSRTIDGSVEVGPNAILAIGREHYRNTSPDWKELRSIVAFPGFRKLASKHWVSGGRELLNSRSRTLYARQARKLVPDLRRGDLTPGGAGVRAQAIDAQGNLVDDFVIEEAGRTVHVLNAPSPGATASLAIGRHIARHARAIFAS
jgi:(S)-2-hydroxyglutarate dehydrogenase